VMENPKVDVVFGMHIEAGIEEGTIEWKSGSFMAAADFFTIRVKGKPSHGSQPWLGIDPVTASAQIINGLQTIVSRQSDLTKAPVVITVGKIQGGVRNNIISEQVEMLGTIRTLDSGMQRKVHEQFRHVIKTIGDASGAETEVEIDTKTLVTYNDPALVQKMLPSIRKAIGAANVKEREWVTGAEDFSYFGTRAPSFFLYLGGMPKGNDPLKAPPHHTADFFVTNSAMKTGVEVFCQLVTDYMNIK
jgi:amidohydrolase